MGKERRTMRGEHFCSKLSIVQASLTMVLVGRGLPCEELIIHSCFTYFEGCGAASGSSYVWDLHLAQLQQSCWSKGSDSIFECRRDSPAGYSSTPLNFQGQQCIGEPFQQGTWLDQGAICVAKEMEFWLFPNRHWRALEGDERKNTAQLWVSPDVCV